MTGSNHTASIADLHAALADPDAARAAWGCVLDTTLPLLVQVGDNIHPASAVAARFFDGRWRLVVVARTAPLWATQ
jgi:hypothetical protein